MLLSDLQFVVGGLSPQSVPTFVSQVSVGSKGVRSEARIALDYSGDPNPTSTTSSFTMPFERWEDHQVLWASSLPMLLLLVFLGGLGF